MARRLLLAGALLAAGPGCDGCDGGPAVPFTIDGSATAPPPASVAPGVGAAPAASVGEGAAPADPGKLAVAGRTIAATAGHRFTQVLSGDADGDGTDDAFAWEASAGGGRLVFVSGQAGDPHEVHLEKPRAGCRVEARLARIGRETALLELDVPCDGDAGVRQSRRSVVVRLPPPGDGAPEARLVIDVGEPQPGERLELTVAAADRDADGREDVVLRATLTGAPPGFARDVSAAGDVVYLDRPAGYTLQPSEPEASLSRAAADLLKRARTPADAEAAAAAAVPLVRLGTALCGDLGAPLVTTTAGAIRCGEMRAIADAFAAMAWGALTRRDVPRAVAAVEAVRSLGDRGAASLKALEPALAREAPIVDARAVARLALASRPSPSPSSPPLAWEGEGTLLALDGDQVVRLRPDGTSEPAEAAAWPRALRWSSSGEPAQIVSAVRRCGPAALVATVERGSARIDVALPDLLALVPRGVLAEPCTAGRVDVAALSLGADRAVIAVGPLVTALVADGPGVRGELTTLPAPGDAPAPPGGARAADGRAVALLGAGDALVIGGRTRRWRAPEIASASACAPSPGGERIACAGARGIAILEAPADGADRVAPR